MLFALFSLQPRDNADLKAGSLTFAMSEVVGSWGCWWRRPQYIFIYDQIFMHIQFYTNANDIEIVDTFFFEFGNSCEQATGLTDLKSIVYD